MVRYCTSGLLYFTSQRRVKCSPQVQCLTILHSTPCNDNFIIIILTPKEMAYNSGNPGGAVMVELQDHSCRFTSVIGNTTIAELESTPKDSDLVGGASSPCTWSTSAAKAQREFGLFGVTSATVRAFLLGAALYTTAHYKNTACKTSSRTAVAKQTGPFLAVSMHVSKRPLLRMRSS